MLFVLPQLHRISKAAPRAVAAAASSRSCHAHFWGFHVSKKVLMGAGPLGLFWLLARLLSLFNLAGSCVHNHLSSTEKSYHIGPANSGSLLSLGDLEGDYVSSLQQLFMLYADLGDFTRAEPLLRQVVELRKAKGETAPAYIYSLHDQALLYYKMGDLARAEPLLRRILGMKGLQADAVLHAAVLGRRSRLFLLARLHGFPGSWRLGPVHWGNLVTGSLSFSCRGKLPGIIW
jgi:tetratricopeptide (TPR) repeat protein